jgi:hypothetical protein
MRRNLWNAVTTGQLISPSVGISNGMSATISYSYKAANWSANTVAATNWGTFDVQYGATATGPWTTFATVTNETQLGNACISKSHTITLPSGNTFLRFSALWQSGDYYLNFDNIIVTQAAATPCAGTPSAGTASISSASGCSGVNFTLSATGLSTGTGITYQWQSSSTSTGPWSNIASATLTSLSTSATSTSYYQLVTTCSNSSSSATSNPVLYTIAGNTCTCGAYPANYASSTADEDITNVTVGTLNNTSTCATLAPGTGSIQNRYSNYTGSVTGPSALQGDVVPFSLTMTTCGGNFGNFFQIYVDWNQNGSFLDAGEQVYSQAASVTGNQTVTGNFTVPLTATLGTTRMRIVNIEIPATTLNYGQSTSFSWGETEDYCFTVTAAVACSGTPNTGTASISSSSGCASTNFTLTGSGLTSGTGITYQWQSSSTGLAGSWVDIVGANSTTLTTTAATTTYYQLVTTCSNSGQTGISNAVSFTSISCIIAPTSGVSYTTSCGITIYDSGGSSGNYTSAESNTVIIRPTSMDQIITVVGTYSTEANFDYVRIDEGEDSYVSSFYEEYTGAGSINHTVSGPGIPLVVHFYSDGSTESSGYSLTVSCACAKPTAISLSVTDAPCNGTGSIVVNSVTASNTKIPWIMTTFENDQIPTLPWLPFAAPNAWLSGNNPAVNVSGNNNMVRLTTANNDLTGALVFREYGQNKNILSGYFDIFIDNGTSADGFAFSYGPGISQMNPLPYYSYSNYESGVGNGLSISFDTYNNGTTNPFPLTSGGNNLQNIYVIYDGVVIGTFSNANYTGFRGSQNFIQLYISGTGLLYLNMNGNTTLFNGLQLPTGYVSSDKSSWKAAFTARTGAVNDRHRVDNINLFHYADYEYSIDGINWQTSATFSGLAPGTYTIYVRYKGNVTCSFTQNFTITTTSQPPSIISISPP